MTRRKLNKLGATAAALLLCASATHAVAEVVTCATEQAISCTPFEPCARSLPGSVNLPVLVKLDTETSLIKSVHRTGEERSSTISSAVETEGTRIFQNVDAGAPWSIQIEKTAGRLSGVIIGDADSILPDNPGGDILRGAAIGGIAGNAGKGAAAGVLLGGIKRNW